METKTGYHKEVTPCNGKVQYEVNESDFVTYSNFVDCNPCAMHCDNCTWGYICYLKKDMQYKQLIQNVAKAVIRKVVCKDQTISQAVEFHFEVVKDENKFPVDYPKKECEAKYRFDKDVRNELINISKK